MKSLKSQVPVDQRIMELQQQVSSHQQMIETTRSEKDELVERNNELKRSLEVAEVQLRDLDIECQRYVCPCVKCPNEGCD